MALHLQRSPVEAIMRLDSFLPTYFIRETHHFAVKTSPAETYRAMCNFDMANIPWIRALFRIRTLLDPKSADFVRFTLRDAYSHGGFVLLEEQPDQELVVGAIGKIWRPRLAFETVTPDQFSQFRNKGFGKVAWSMRCEPRIPDGTLGTLEIRVGATDRFSTAKMRAYYSAIAPFSRAIRHSTLRRITQQLGDAYSDESSRFLPGDDIIENVEGSLTHAINIEAPPERIWPWLIQMGCGRAGWYSYDWLDNAGIPSSSRIVSDWQKLKVGDVLPATPQADAGFLVLRMQPPNVLLLGGCWDVDSQQTLAPDVQPLPANYWRSTWAFVLEPQTPSVTRLIVRARGDSRSPTSSALDFRKKWMPQVHNFMERKQLRNLKQRADAMEPLATPA